MLENDAGEMQELIRLMAFRVYTLWLPSPGQRTLWWKPRRGDSGGLGQGRVPVVPNRMWDAHGKCFEMSLFPLPRVAGQSSIQARKLKHVLPVGRLACLLRTGSFLPRGLFR